MSKQHTPTRDYLQNAVNRINDLIPLAELGLQYQKSCWYHSEKIKLSKENIGMAKRFIEYVSEHPINANAAILKACNNHDRLVEALASLSETVAWLADNTGDDASKWDAAFKEVADINQLLTELKS